MADQLAQALAWLHPRRGEMEALLRDLVEINSHTDNVEGVEKVADRLAEELPEMVITVEKYRPSDRYASHLVATTRAKGPRVLLVGHTDTVFRPGTFEGYKSDGERAHGPGVLDMKGGLVVCAYAMRALEAVGVLHDLPLGLVAVSEEEVGSPESQPMLREMAKNARCGLVFESGRPGDVVVTRRKGTAAVKATAHGKAAHAGNAHEEGRNAIWALARFVDAAQRLTDYKRGITVNVGRIEGGQGKNTVPEQAVALVDFRFLADADANAVADALQKAASNTGVEGTTLDLELTIARRALERTDQSAALLATYLECQRAAGLGGSEAPLQGGGSDANTLSSAGLPCIDALGPRGEGYHTKHEYIELNSLVPKAEALVRFLLKA
jgi:glutamate carboxypeptidase